MAAQISFGKKANLTMGIAIRKFEPDDADSLFCSIRESVPHLSLWLPWCSDSYDLAQAQFWVKDSIDAWKTGREYRYLIIEESTGEIAGSVAINQIVKEHSIGNIGYWVRHKYLGRGICTTAVKELIKQAFDVLKFQRLEIIVAEGNEASCRVAEKVGAVFEGVLKNKLRLHGTPVSAYCYSIIAPI